MLTDSQETHTVCVPYNVQPSHNLFSKRYVDLGGGRNVLFSVLPNFPRFRRASQVHLASARRAVVRVTGIDVPLQIIGHRTKHCHKTLKSSASAAEVKIGRKAIHRDDEGLLRTSMLKAFHQSQSSNTTAAYGRMHPCRINHQIGCTFRYLR